MGTVMISLIVIQLDFCFFEDKRTWIEFIDEEGVLAVKSRSEIANCARKSKSEEIKLSTNALTRFKYILSVLHVCILLDRVEIK